MQQNLNLMKRVFFSLFITVFLSHVLKSQECVFYSPVKTGTTLEWKHYDIRGKVVSISKSKVIKSGKTTMGFSCTEHKEFFDDKETLLSEDNIEVKCKADEFSYGMTCYLHDLDLGAYKDKEIQIESDSLTISKDIKPGLLLSFGTSRISVLEEGIPVKNMIVNVYFRRVEGFEEVSTPAGSFNCLKIRYEVETIINQKVKSKGIEWFSQGVGLVKRETYDRSGKLTERIILSSISVTD